MRGCFYMRPSVDSFFKLIRVSCLAMTKCYFFLSPSLVRVRLFRRAHEGRMTESSMNNRIRGNRLPCVSSNRGTRTHSQLALSDMLLPGLPGFLAPREDGDAAAADGPRRVAWEQEPRPRPSIKIACETQTNHRQCSTATGSQIS